MAETVAPEARCDWSDLFVSQCSHCRPPAEEPAPLDFIGIWDGPLRGHAPRTGRGTQTLGETRHRRALYQSMVQAGPVPDVEAARSMRNLGAVPDTVIDDHQGDADWG